jgi:hypothetical protein
MTKNSSIVFSPPVKWYKVVLSGVDSNILERLVVKKTKASLVYLAPVIDYEDRFGVATYRIRGRLVGVAIDGMRYSETFDKISCGKHHWFDNEKDARQCLQDYCYDKIQQRYQELELYRELFNEFHQQ